MFFKPLILLLLAAVCSGPLFQLNLSAFLFDNTLATTPKPLSYDLSGASRHPEQPYMDTLLPANFSTVYDKVGYGNFDLADYDHDGDTDVLNNGIVFRNDSRPDSLYWFLKQFNSPVGVWVSASMVTADFNLDGYKDVFITGQFSDVTAAAKLYLNDKNGGFTLSPQPFAGAVNGKCAVVDFNFDGKPDISYMGGSNLQETAFLIKLYINNGNGSFTEQTTGIPGLTASSLSWADTDGDRDMDLVLNGADASKAYARFFVNTNNTFTEKGIGLTNSCTGEIRFTDVNGDGRPDIVNTGVGTPKNIDVIPTQILLNSGNNNFTALTNTLPPLYRTYTEWADFDGDGDPDLLMSGTRSFVYGAYVYKNNGNGNFTRIDLGDIYSYSPVHWTDINKDGRPDAFVANRFGSSFIAKNMGNDSFAVATYGLPIMPGLAAAVVEDFDLDGSPDILYAGSLSDFTCTIPAGSAYIRGMGWKYITVAKLTPVVDIKQNPGNVGFTEPFWSWGDFDSDGVQDIIVTNNYTYPFSVGFTLKIYKNMGNDVFKLVYDGVPAGGIARRAAFVDLNNDGKNELVFAPNIVYAWNGNGFDFVYQGSSFCCDNFNMAFGDYNKDGYVDMALNANGKMYIYKNDKTGKLVQTNPNLNYQNRLFLRWADMDADGDLDLVTSGYILENVNTDQFVYRATGIPEYSSAAIGDFNGDGIQDMFTLTIQDVIGKSRLYYGQGNFSYKENTPADFPGIKNSNYHETALAFDIDRDGDPDILHSANYCINGLILNNSNLLKKSIQLINPAGGEKLFPGASYTIRWTGNLVGSTVAVSFSTDNGKTYTAINPAAPSASSGGSYLWVLPAVSPSDSCLIKVSDNQAVSISKTVFAIGPSLATPQLGSLSALFCQNQGAQSVSLQNLPPAGDSVAVSATLDGTPLTIASGRISFNVNTLAPGKHALLITYSRNSLSATATGNFTVVAPVVPKLSLQSNLTTIINLTTPLVVTASGVQGGGNLPLFTFAGDPSFRQILQQEGLRSTLTIDPSNLAVGNNWIFVRMKTSDTCYAAPTATDSILLIRDVSTGISDPDNPSAAISVLPNPFRHQIVVKGLSSFKVYRISLLNSNGQTVYTKVVSQHTVEYINGLNISAGVYWIKLFDETKKRELGVMKLTKL